MEVNLKILIVEDNKSDADLLSRALKKFGLSFIAEIVQTREEYENCLEKFQPDIILSDYFLPRFDAVTAFNIKQKISPEIPFIIVSGVIGEEKAVELIKIGITDYSPKDKLFALVQKIHRALKETEIRREKIIIDEQLKNQTAQLIILNQELEERVITRTKALEKSENQYRRMIESLPQIAWTDTTGGEKTFYNKRWYEYTGLSYEQTKATGWQDIIHPDDLHFTLEQGKLIRASGMGGEFQNRKKRKDGVYLWHLVRLEPFNAGSNEDTLWVGTATDINYLKILQQNKDDFINIASHELKTPLTSLKGSLQLLNIVKDSPDSNLLPKLIDLANRSVNNLCELVDDILNTGEVNNGQIQVNLKRFLMSKAIDDCCSNIRSENNYTIIAEGDLGLYAYGDEGRIGQVVTNFVNNAIKYAPESKEIRILIENVKEMAKVSVTDKGPGISAEKIPYLFDRYYRGENGGTSRSGLGLGLFISQEIIKKQNGQIGMVSQLGQGSTFWFTLPLA